MNGFSEEVFRGRVRSPNANRPDPDASRERSHGGRFLIAPH